MTTHHLSTGELDDIEAAAFLAGWRICRETIKMVCLEETNRQISLERVVELQPPDEEFIRGLLEKRFDLEG